MTGRNHRPDREAPAPRQETSAAGAAAPPGTEKGAGAPPDWSAAQYLRFEEERSRPARDLIARIATDPVARAVDLGCGPGNSTELLHARYPGAQILGIDTSPDMLAAARGRLPGASFEAADIARWDDPGPFDVIFSNAALQWVPGHDRLLPGLLSRLSPGGSLAVQMPDNLDEPSHRLMREIAADGPWAGALAGAAATRVPRQSPDWYWRLLRGAGAASVDLWRTSYFHPLDGPEGIIAWLKSTGLRPFLAPLDARLAAAFLDRYRAALAEAYPAAADGKVLLAFPRLFFVATR